jgi:ribosomal-protein-alanine N-acetyltransferase
MTIGGPGVRLEPITPNHADPIQWLAADAEVARTCWLPHPYPAGAAATWVRGQIEARERGESLAHAVMHSGDGLVGICTLLGLRPAAPSGQLSFWIGRPYWGRGYATAAAGQLVALGLGPLELREILSCTLGSNLASRRVLAKLGFRPTSAAPNPYPKFRAGEVVVQFRLTEV